MWGRKYHLRVNYGLTLEQHAEMEERQGGLCALCGSPPFGNRRLDIDHDHTTGVIRGLLCSRCNTALGSFMDSPHLLQAAITYLEVANGLG